MPTQSEGSIKNWIRDDGRYPTMRAAVRFINFEMVPGNILEFGVGNGKTLATLALLQDEDLIQARYKDAISLNRQAIGFDSFEGLSHDDGHPRWYEGIFRENYDIEHPFFKPGEKLSPELPLALCKAMKIKTKVMIEEGAFDKTLPPVLPKYEQAALVHIDCDLYEPTKVIFQNIEPLLQDGTMILFDDWFCYKGNPHKGEQKAFKEFLAQYPRWEAIHYRTYATHCNAFILHDTALDSSL